MPKHNLLFSKNGIFYFRKRILYEKKEYSMFEKRNLLLPEKHNILFQKKTESSIFQRENLLFSENITFYCQTLDLLTLFSENRCFYFQKRDTYISGRYSPLYSEYTMIYFRKILLPKYRKMVWVYGSSKNRVRNFTKNGLNRVAVARHGLKLWENDATSLNILFKCVLGLKNN